MGRSLKVFASASFLLYFCTRKTHTRTKNDASYDQYKMHKVCSFFMVIGLAAALHVNAQGGGFQGPGGGGRPMGPPPGGMGMGGGMHQGGMHEGGMMMMPPPHEKNEERSTVENQFTINSGCIIFKDAKFALPNGELMRVKRDKRKNKKGNGHLLLSSDTQCTYEGNVYVDKKCEGSVTVDSGVTWTGAVNHNKRSRQVTVNVDGTWNLTDDSYVNKLVIGKDAMINTNGHKLKYNTLENNGILN